MVNAAKCKDYARQHEAKLHDQGKKGFLRFKKFFAYFISSFFA